MAQIVSRATASVARSIMGTGPIPASRTAPAKADRRVGNLDLIKTSEARAVNNNPGWDTGKVPAR